MRSWLKSWPRRPPAPEQEAADPEAADGFYTRAGNWLRENTRSKKKFDILFNENVTYGYRRNLLPSSGRP